MSAAPSGPRSAPGDEIVVTTLDHEANVSPWRALAADRDLVVRTVDIHARGRHPRPRPARVACSGRGPGWSPWARPPTPWAPSTRWRGSRRWAHAAGALVFVDAVHYVPHAPVDVATLGADFLVTSPYKWFGPHSGVLWARDGVLDRLPAYKVRPAHAPVATGTPTFELIAGVAAAVEYLADIGGCGR